MFLGHGQSCCGHIIVSHTRFEVRAALCLDPPRTPSDSALRGHCDLRPLICYPPLLHFYCPGAHWWVRVSGVGIPQELVGCLLFLPLHEMGELPRLGWPSPAPGQIKAPVTGHVLGFALLTVHRVYFKMVHFPLCTWNSVRFPFHFYSVKHMCFQETNPTKKTGAPLSLA